MSYLKEFQSAASRTKRLGLGDVSLSETAVAIDQTILNLLEESCPTPFAGRAGAVLNVNFGMFHMLSKKLHIPGAVLTFGNVAAGGVDRYPADAPLFRRMVEEESGEENLGRYHVWTTLPGGVIIDHAVMSSLAHDGLVEVDDAVPSERFVYGPADALEFELSYRPLVLGHGFLVASGTIDPEAMDYLMGSRFPKQYD